MDLLGSALGFFGDFIGAGLSYNAQSEANKINKDIAEEQNRLAKETLEYNKKQDAALLEYNKWLNQTQMDREDTAVQRRISDLRAAGLSPLLAAGDAAGSSAGSNLSRSQIVAPDLQGYDYQNPFSGFNGLGQDLYNASIKGYAEYQQAEKNKAETSLLQSQTEAKNIENSWLVNKMYDESEERFFKLQKARADIALTSSKLIGQERDNYLKEVQGYIAYIENEMKRIQYDILKHDADIVTSSVYPSGVILSDVSNGFNEFGMDYKKLNHWEGQHNGGAGASEEIPLPNNIDRGIDQTEMLSDGSLIYGNYYGTGYLKDEYYYAGNGYKIKSDDTMWYGQYQVKPEFVDAVKAMLATYKKGRVPKNVLDYSFGIDIYKDRHDEMHKESTYERYNHNDYNQMH